MNVPPPPACVLSMGGGKGRRASHSWLPHFWLMMMVRRRRILKQFYLSYVCMYIEQNFMTWVPILKPSALSKGVNRLDWATLA